MPRRDRPERRRQDDDDPHAASASRCRTPARSRRSACRCPSAVREAKKRDRRRHRSSTASTPTSPAPRTCASTARYFGLRARDDRRARPEAARIRGAAVEGRRARPGELSGGMKRRLTLGRALVNDPDLLLLDEPTTGLDPQARHLMWERLQNLLQQGKAILLTTHFMDEAERLCDRLIVHRPRPQDRRRHAARADRRALESDVVEVYGDGAAPWPRAHGRARRARGDQRRDGLLLPARAAAAARRAAPTHPACATCTGRRTSRTCSSSSPAARSATTPDDDAMLHLVLRRAASSRRASGRS